MNPTARTVIAEAGARESMDTCPNAAFWLDTFAPPLLAALRVAAGAPEGAAIVIQPDGTLGWLEQRGKIPSEAFSYCPPEERTGRVFLDLRPGRAAVPLFRVVGIDPEGDR